MKTILLLAHDDEGQEARLQVALDVTRALEGHLTCLGVIVPPTALAFDYTGYGIAALMEDDRERETANRSRLEERLSHEDVTWNWHEATGYLEESIEAEAGLADLIILSSCLAEDEPATLRQLAGHVADKARRPVLAVPSHAKGLEVTGPVLVAWDGSREADEALREAVPLLKLSSEVVLIDLDEPEGAFAARSAAVYLSRHDIHARIETAPRKLGDTVYTKLLGKATQVGASYIVMGAFGHAPAVETVFGGVTRSMLANSDLPLLLAH